MKYHCDFCGGFLKFWEGEIHGGRIFHCDCNKCGHKIEQKSFGYFVKATVISNKRIS